MSAKYIKGPRHTKYRFVDGKLDYVHVFDNPKAKHWDTDKFGDGAAKRRLKQAQFHNWK